LKREAWIEARTTHGGRKTPAYSIWSDMKRRCLAPSHSSFKHYGGRGIAVCERWDSFENFLADMGQPPPGMSIDRIDVNGNYEPSNCRWATAETQRNNRRCSHFVESAGKLQTIAQWSRDTGIPERRIADRLRNGFSAEDALSPNPLPRRRKRVGQ